MNNYEVYEGISLKKLHRIEGISYYNNNYYIGFKREGKCASDLLYVKSDDDNTSEIYHIKGDMPIHIGYCYTSENDMIRLGGSEY